MDAVAEGRRYHDVLRKFAVFALVGGGATAVHYAVLFMLVQGLGAGPVLSSSAGAVCGAIVSYILNYRVTFCAVTRHIVALPRFVAMVLTGILLNSLLMYFFVYFVSMHYVLSQIATTLLVLVFNFYISARFVFTGGNDDALL